MYFWSLMIFCIKWFCPKNVIFCLKNAFFWQKMQYIPLSNLVQLWCQETFFPLVFFYLNSEGFFIASYSTWWNPPLNIFNLAKNGPFLEDLKKKVSKSHWNHIHKVCVTQIHYVTWFLTPFLLKMPQFLLKTVIFVSFKNPHFCLFPGVLHGKLKFQDKYYNKIDYNKWPSSEKQDENVFLENHVFTRFNLHIDNIRSTMRSASVTPCGLWCSMCLPASVSVRLMSITRVILLHTAPHFSISW